MTDVIIDGSKGEGGGQMVRSSIALALVTGKSVRIDNIRAGRSKPGLMRQHLTAVRAAAEIGGNQIQGDEIRSSTLEFYPGTVQPGNYKFSVGTAGSATLVLQTILPGLLTADGPFDLILEGGTHNPWAPPYEFLANSFFPLIEKMGPRITCELQRHGFYPAGGGRFQVRIEPSSVLRGIELLKRGPLVNRSATAIVSRLPRQIGQREIDVLERKLNWPPTCFHVKEVRDSNGPGNVVHVEIASEHVTEVFIGFGRQGTKAENVAKETLKQARAYMASDAPVGPYLADQIMLPLAIAAWKFDSPSQFLTLPFTRHSKTQIEVIRDFLDIPISVEPDNRSCIVKFGRQ